MESRILKNKQICTVTNTGKCEVLANYPAYELVSRDKLKANDLPRNPSVEIGLYECLDTKCGEEEADTHRYR